MAPPVFRLLSARALRRLVLCAALALCVGPVRAEHGALESRLAALEQQGRARPREAAQELETLLAQVPADHTLRIDALQLLGWLHARTPDPEALERVAAQLETLARQRPLAAAAAAYIRAQWIRAHGSLGRADRLMTDAIARLPADVAPAQRLRYVGLHASIKERAGRLEDGVRLYQEALRLADHAGVPWQRADLRSGLAYTLFEAGQHERARAINAEAIAIARELNDHLALAGAMTTEAILLTRERDDAAELRAWQAAIEHARRAGAQRDEVLGLANIADYYLTRGQYATALAAASQALPLAREIRDSTAESVALANIGLSLISLRDKDEGLRHVQASLAIDERMGSATGMASTYLELGKYLEQAGFLADALAAYGAHRRLADEVFRRDQQQAIVELQEGFDHERRQRDLALLERENRLKEAQLLNRSLQQWLWVAAVGVCVLLLATGSLLYRRVRASNARLADSNAQLLVLSERDPLTGLANRRHFQAVMRQAPSLDGTVFLIDIDHFKQINDGHGHAAGDAVLVEIARRLRQTLRDEDLIVRWGGEEFLVVVRALAAERVQALAQRLLAALADTPVAVGDSSIAISGSIGFATFPLEPGLLAVGWERAIHLVDTAMYLAKSHGRNRAYGVHQMMADDESQLEGLTRELEQAWRNGRVALTLLRGPVAAVTA